MNDKLREALVQCRSFLLAHRPDDRSPVDRQFGKMLDEICKALAEPVVLQDDLRDYFAAHAPLDSLKFASSSDAARFAGCDAPTTDDELMVVGMKAAAKAAYIYADAMLKERSKT